MYSSHMPSLHSPRYDNQQSCHYLLAGGGGGAGVGGGGHELKLGPVWGGGGINTYPILSLDSR